MMGAYAATGAKLVERGYAALPVAPGTKVPGHMLGGAWCGMNGWSTRYTERLPTDIEVDHWSAWTDAGVCLVAGAASRGVTGIDIDVDEVEIVAAIKAVLPPSPVRKAGQKGETLFFRSSLTSSKSFNEYGTDGKVVRRLCDVIGPGRQTVLPPTVHPDTGKPYRWIGEAALENIDPDELPELPDDVMERLADALRPFGYQERPTTQEKPGAPRPAMSADTDSPFRVINDAAMANLDAWVSRLGLFGLRPARGGYEAVATWRASSTGKPLERRKRNLKIHPSGIKDMGADEAFTPLDLVMRANDCDFDTALGQLVGWLGLGAGLEIDLQPRATHRQMDDGSLVDMETGEIVTPVAAVEIAAPETSSGIVDFESEILKSPCLVGEIARWVLRVARRRQPRLAIAAALGLVATAASRQMQTPTHSNLNLYLLITARTGMGKDAPMKATKLVLAASKLLDMLGPDGAASDVGLLGYARRSPASIMPIDEFGDFIGAVSGMKAASHSIKIMATMRTLWDGGLISTSNAQSRPSEILANPCISMICASTPAQFYDAIGSAQVLNGFINRFVLFNGAKDAARGLDDADMADVPFAIKDGMTKLAQRPAGINHMRFRLMADNLLDEDRPHIVPWDDEAAKALWIRYEDFNLERMRDDERLEAFAPRCPQNALRIATVLAIAENIAYPRVSERHIDLGISIAETSLADMLSGYNNHVPETAGAALAAKALQRIKDAGGTMSRRDLLKSMKRSFKSVRELDDLMNVLVEAGDVGKSTKIPDGGGPTTVLYHAMR